MSTPAYKKRQREEAQRKAKVKRDYERELASFKAKRKDKEFVEYKPAETYRRETPSIPSVGSLVGNGTTPRSERKQYTGDLIIGIATMHKSNAVPVMRDTNQATEISQMGK
jgi:hypothetical protein